MLKRKFCSLEEIGFVNIDLGELVRFVFGDGSVEAYAHQPRFVELLPQRAVDT